MFESCEDTDARGAWNALLRRAHGPQVITLANILHRGSVWIDGTKTTVTKGDSILFVFEHDVVDAATNVTKTERMYALRRAQSTNLDTDHDRMELVLEPVRPYYLNLYDAAFKLWTTPPPTPLEPVKKTKKATTKAVAHFSPLPIVKQILLGASRTFLKGRFGNPAELRDLLNAPDDDKASAV